MKPLLCASLFALCLCCSPHSPDPLTPEGGKTRSSSVAPPERGNFEKEEFPFEDYPVSKIYSGRFAKLQLSEGQKDLYGEKLQFSVENSPRVNFAGHFMVTSWSCGMWCSWSAVVDAKTGSVYLWDGILSPCFPDLDTDFVCDREFSNIEYRVGSRLIVFFGMLYENQLDDRGVRGFHFYEFEDGIFRYIKSVQVKEQRSPSQIQVDRPQQSVNK